MSMSSSMRRRVDNLDQLVADYVCGSKKAPHAFTVAYELYEAIDTPVSLACYLLLKYREYEQLAKKGVSPQNYLSVGHFDDDYQAVSYLKKYSSFPGMAKKARAAATASFYKAEEICREANLRLRAFRRSQNTSFSVHSVLYRAREICHAVLGRFNTDLWFHSCRFGPGVSDTCAKPGTSYYKLGSPLSVTKAFREMALQLVAGSPSWARAARRQGLGDFSYEGPPSLRLQDLRLTIGNTVTFVQKNASTDRVIAIEPHLNIFAQLGIGSMIRGCLKRAGIDLDHQADHHATLAEIASIIGDLATIDLSMASDTICYEIIRELIPSDWFHAMDLVRSKTGVLNDEVVHYEKFSSMGNGFTFELETLIFWSLSRAASEYVGAQLYDERGLICSCFGDDLIVPVKAEPLLKEVLGFCGFTYNTDKTYVKSAFRESCGHDYFVGVNVRPIFQKETITNVETTIGAANRLRLKSYSRNRGFGCDHRFRRVWLACLKPIPQSLREALLGPASVEANYYTGKTRLVAGDTHIVDNLDSASRSPFVRYELSAGGYSYGRLGTHIHQVVPDDFYAIVASALYECRTLEACAPQVYGITMRNRTSTRDQLFLRPENRRWGNWGDDSTGRSSSQFLGRGQTCFSQTVGHVESWPNLGPWI